MQRAEVGIGDENQRENIEKDERERWVRELVFIMQQGGAPVVDDLFGDGESPIAVPTRRFAKGRRANTLRKHVRTWQRAMRYWQFTFGVQWPRHPFHMVSYLENRAAEPCNRTVPMSIDKTFMFMEYSAEVSRSDMLHTHPSVKNALEEITLELENASKGETKQALHYPVRLVEAMEVLVVKEEAPAFVRGLAWVKLIKVWGAMRHSDTTGMKYESLSMEPYGLAADLVRTKTTGPGKKVKVVKVFVSRAAFIKEASWLQAGWELWRKMSMEAGLERRDYLLPYPTGKLDGCLARMANYAAASAMTNAMADFLETVFEGADVRLLEPGVMSCWTEHSERTTIRSWARAANVPEDVCKRIGRWTPTVDQAYDRSACMQIMSAQVHVANFIKGNAGRADPFDENSILVKVAQYMEEAGYPDGAAEVQLEKLMFFRREGGAPPKRLRWAMPGDFGPPQDKLEADSSGAESDGTIPASEGADGRRAVPLGSYVVSIVGNSKTRTLHRVGECFRILGLHFANFIVCGPEPPKVDQYHKACKVCFPRGQRMDQGPRAEEDSSGDISSSDEEKSE